MLAILAATLSWPLLSPQLPPNRGTQLFLVVQPRSHELGGDSIVAITEHRTDVYQLWHPKTGTYDFLAAVVTSQFAGGTAITITRSVMTDDYVPRIEQSDFTFPFTEQPRYRFGDFGYITAFYRNSVEDFDPMDVLPHSSPNQSMQLTAFPGTALPLVHD